MNDQGPIQMTPQQRQAIAKARARLRLQQQGQPQPAAPVQQSPARPAMDPLHMVNPAARAQVAANQPARSLPMAQRPGPNDPNPIVTAQRDSAQAVNRNFYAQGLETREEANAEAQRRRDRREIASSFGGMDGLEMQLRDDGTAGPIPERDAGVRGTIQVVNSPSELGNFVLEAGEALAPERTYDPKDRQATSRRYSTPPQKTPAPEPSASPRITFGSRGGGQPTPLPRTTKPAPVPFRFPKVPLPEAETPSDMVGDVGGKLIGAMLMPGGVVGASEKVAAGIGKALAPTLAKTAPIVQKTASYGGRLGLLGGRSAYDAGRIGGIMGEDGSKVQTAYDWATDPLNWAIEPLGSIINRATIFVKTGGKQVTPNRVQLEGAMNTLQRGDASPDQMRAAVETINRITPPRPVAAATQPPQPVAPTATQAPQQPKFFDPKGDPVDVQIVAQSENGGVVVRTKDGREIIVGEEVQSRSARDPSYVVEWTGSGKPVSAMTDAELAAAKQRADEVITSRSQAGQSPMSFVSDRNAIIYETRRRASGSTQAPQQAPIQPQTATAPPVPPIPPNAPAVMAGAPQPGPAGQVPPVGQLNPVPNLGPAEQAFNNLPMKTRESMLNAFKSAGVEPNRAKAMIGELNNLPDGQNTMYALEIMRRNGLSDPDIDGVLVAMGREFATESPRPSGRVFNREQDSARQIMNDQVRTQINSEGRSITDVAESRFGPGVVPAGEALDLELDQLSNAYETILSTKRSPTGNLRSPAKKDAVYKAREDLTNALVSPSVMQTIPADVKLQIMMQASDDMRRLKFKPEELDVVLQGDGAVLAPLFEGYGALSWSPELWSHLARQYPTQAAHSLQSALRKAADEAFRRGDATAGRYYKRLRGESGKGGLLDTLERAVPKYKETRVQFGDASSAKEALDILERFKAAAANEGDVAKIIKDLDGLPQRHREMAEQQITSIIRQELARKVESPRLAELGQTVAQTPNLTALSRQDFLKALEDVFGPRGKELADSIRSSRARTDTLTGISPKYNSRTELNRQDVQNAPALYEAPGSLEGGIIDQGVKRLGTVAGGASLIPGGQGAAIALGAATAVQAAMNAARRGQRLSNAERNALVDYLFKSRTAGDAAPAAATRGPSMGDYAQAIGRDAVIGAGIGAVADGDPLNNDPMALIGGALGGAAGYGRARFRNARSLIKPPPAPRGAGRPNPPPAGPGVGGPNAPRPLPGQTSSASPAVTGAVVGGIGGAMADRENPGRGFVVGAAGGGVLGAGAGRLARGVQPPKPRVSPPPVGGRSPPVRMGFGAAQQAEERGPMFYSALSRAVDRSPTTKAPASQWKATIANSPGVKAEEIEWTGVNDWLDMQTGPVTKQQVAEYLDGNGVKIEETVRGAPSGEALRKQEEIQRELLPRIEKLQRLNNEFDQIAETDAVRAAVLWREIKAVAAEAEALKQALDAADVGTTTKWSSYTLPGGENYRELLIRMPDADRSAARASSQAAAFSKSMREKYGEQWISRLSTDEMARYDALIEQSPAQGYKSSHWDEPNVLAHIRFKERTSADGKRVLAIEEIQSDWHQAGRDAGAYNGTLTPENFGIKKITSRDGEDRWIVGIKESRYFKSAGNNARGFASFKDEAAAVESLKRNGARWASEQNKGLPPNAPFKDNAWASLSLKRMIRWAAENGFDEIAWVPGQVPVERFNLSQALGDVTARQTPDGRVSFTPGNGSRAARQSLQRFGEAGRDGDTIMTREQAVEAFGKDAGSRMFDGASGQGKVFAGEDLNVGGEGMRAFYDKILVNEANKLGKKYGAQVGRATVVTNPKGYTVTGKQGQFLGSYANEAEAQQFAKQWSGATVAHPSETFHSLPITPELKKQALGGQALMSIGGRTGRGIADNLKQDALLAGFGSVGGSFANQDDPQAGALAGMGLALGGKYGGRAVNAMRGAGRVKPPPVRGAAQGKFRGPNNQTFAGVNAKTADKAALARAQNMEAEGASRNDIWDETGWFKGVDGKWRFEIDDSGATLTGSKSGFLGKTNPASERLLGDGRPVMEHSALYDAYPDLIGAHASISGKGGTYIPSSKYNDEMIRAGAEDPRSIMLHEAGGHGVQEREGFARGGSMNDVAASLAERKYLDLAKQSEEILSRPDVVAAQKRFDELKAKWQGRSDIPPDIVDELRAIQSMPEKRELARIKADANSMLRKSETWGPDALFTKDELFDGYRRLAGEAEARNVQTRDAMRMRGEKPGRPWETQDVPDDQQIVRFGSGKAESRPKGPPSGKGKPPKVTGTDAAGRPMYDFRGATVSHFTDAEAAADIATGGYKVVGDGYYGEAVSFTPDRKFGSQFGGVETQATVAPTARILQTSDPDDWAIIQKVLNDRRLVPNNPRPGMKSWRQAFLDMGVDGLYDGGAGDLFIYNPSVVKPAALAKGKPTTSVPVTRKPPPQTMGFGGMGASRPKPPPAKGPPKLRPVEARRAAPRGNKPFSDPRLSPGENKTAEMLLNGYGYDEIADEMMTSRGVIKVQASAAQKKLGTDVQLPRPGGGKRPPGTTKKEAAFELFDQGLPSAIVAERINMPRVNVSNYRGQWLKKKERDAARASVASADGSLYNPPAMPERPFEADYPREDWPDGPPVDAQGRLMQDMDRKPLDQNAAIIGRNKAPGYGAGSEADRPLRDRIAVIQTLKQAGSSLERIPRSSDQTSGGWAPTFDAKSRFTGRGSAQIADDLDRPIAGLDDQEVIVLSHELAHSIDFKGGPKALRARNMGDFNDRKWGIDHKGMRPEARAQLESQLERIYRDLNNPVDGPVEIRTPKDHGYEAIDADRELWAEAIRAYMYDPNYIKTVAPEVAFMIRDHVNRNKSLRKTIQFNAIPTIVGVGGLGLGAAALSGQPAEAKERKTKTPAS